MEQIRGGSEYAAVTTGRIEHANHMNIADATSPYHPTNTKTAVASIVGCLFLVICASITIYCAILSELQGWEPSLRGLVHAGVMLLFAGICIEPLLFSDSSNSSYNSSQTQTQPNDAHGMGIIFAGLGMFFVGSVGVSTLLRLSISESSETSAWNFAFLVAVAAVLISSTILLRVMFLPVMNDNDMSSHAYRSQGLALACFTLGSMLSVLHTWQIVLKEFQTNDVVATENSPPWMVLLLDVMAYVFHRAFIGSILVGGGFGSSSENDSTTALHRPRQLLRCRYRAFFLLVGINLSLSWFLCDQYMSSFLVLISALLQWKEGILFCQRLHPYEIRRWKRGDDTRVSLSTTSNSSRSRSSRVTQHHWLQLVLLGGHRFSSTPFMAANFAFPFYTATLFADGVLLHSNPNNNINLGGLDACLVKAVHVAAVWAAMLAIFPRLLLVAPRSVSFHRVVKGVCALMSTVDVMICLGILFFTSHQTKDDSSSSSSENRVYILWARILGATLQSLAFGTLQVHTSPWVMEPSIELASLTTNEGEVDTVMTDSRTSEQQQAMEDDTANEVGETESSTYDLQCHYENVDAFAVLTWIVYFATHVLHSCAWSSSTGTTTTTMIATEMQLSKIFHFQVITIGFYSSGIFRRDIMSWTIVAVFATLEMAGILACHYQQEQQQQDIWNGLSWDRMSMVVASLLLLWDCGVRLLFRRHDHDGWIETTRAKKDETVGDGAGAVLFPN